MFKFKNKNDKTEVFKGGKLIGILDRVKDPVSEKYFEKPRYIYTVTNPITGGRDVFDSRQKAAYRLQSLTDYLQHDENKIKEKFEQMFKIYMAFDFIPTPDDDVEKMALECAIKVKEIKDEYLKKAIVKEKTK